MAVRVVGPYVQGLDVVSNAISADAATSAISSATATVLMTAGPVYFPGGTYDVLLSAPAVTKGTTSITLELWIDGVFSQSIVAAVVNATNPNPFFWTGRVTVVDGVHTFTVRGFVDAGTGNLRAGTGATGQSPNALLVVRSA